MKTKKETRWKLTVYFKSLRAARAAKRVVIAWTDIPDYEIRRAANPAKRKEGEK